MTTKGFARVSADAPANGAVAAGAFEKLVGDLRATFNSGKTRDLKWRRQQLEALQQMVEENYEEMGAAVRATHEGGRGRGVGDVLGTFEAAQMALDNLDAWAKDEKVATPVANSPTMLGSSYVRKEGKGVVLILAPWNYPIELCLSPLVSALAAGNCVVVKPSEITPKAAAVIKKLLEKYLDTSAVRVVEGGVPETTALLKLKWDHIFYTGNGFVARIVMKAAAEHLTPVTLELGGKSPVIIDKSAKMDAVVNRVSQGKWFNAGQTCIAPDYVLVHKDRKAEFLKGMKDWLATSYGADPKASGCYGRVVNTRHVERVAKLLKESSGEVQCGGADKIDGTYFPPTILTGVAADEPLLKEEIFGPVLPVLEIDSAADAVPIVNKVCDRPLALYIFSEDKKQVQSVLDKTLSGGVGVNTCVDQYINSNLPFGGIGESGMGRTHGKYGFDEFTHTRAVFKQDTLLNRMAAVPPPPQLEKLYEVVMRVLVIGVIPRRFRAAVRRVVRAVLYAVLFFAVKKMLSNNP
eukprot:TRINITY_DN288_c0_g1_i3.p1 TRINITY_DN288_c0_g1~~TRINITY_DN288_c0_g1_i3.p1  ORF type:complete len:521 (+),score=222.56 TRINITY_DN288_c0_g1_i3:58-1620(+)